MTGEADQTIEASDVVPQEKLSLSILEEVSKSHAQNGVTHGDYQRYRQYCARRLRRLRVALKHTHGKSKQFVQRSLGPEEVEETRHLLIPLVNAERAWAYAMDRKQDQEDDEENTRPRFHARRRLAKAEQWARQLRDLCAAVADDRTALEAEAYAAWMSGTSLVERERWAAAQEAFTASSAIYSRLADVGSTLQRRLCAARVRETAPLLRYCAYSLRRAGAAAQDAGELMGLGAAEQVQARLAAVMASARSEAETHLSAVSFRGRVVPVDSARTRKALARGHAVAEKLAGAGGTATARLQAYSELLSAYDEAAELARAEAEKLEKSATAGAVEQARLLEQYARELRLRHALDRALLLAERALPALRGAGAGASAELVSAAEAAEAAALWAGAAGGADAAGGAVREQEGEAAGAAGEAAAATGGAASASAAAEDDASLETLCAVLGLAQEAAAGVLALRGAELGAEGEAGPGAEAEAEDEAVCAHANATVLILGGARRVVAAEVYARRRRWEDAAFLAAAAEASLEGCEAGCAALAADGDDDGRTPLLVSRGAASVQWLAAQAGYWLRQAQRATPRVAARSHLAARPALDGRLALAGLVRAASLATASPGAEVEPAVATSVAEARGVLDAPCGSAVDAAGALLVQPLPAEPEPVPAKPVLFDLAIDYVMFPTAHAEDAAEEDEAEDAVAAAEQAEQQAASGGGWFSSWLGR